MHALWGKGLVWLSEMVVCLLARYQRSNC